MRYAELVILSTLCWRGVNACTGDNCLRALEGNATPASAFCASYTASLITASTSFPNFLSPCSASSSKLSSACTCFAGATTASTRTSTTTTSFSSTSSSSSCPGTTITVTPSTCALATTYTSISIITSVSIITSTTTVTDNVTLSAAPLSTVTITDDITIPPSTVTDSVVVTTTQDVAVTTTVQVETDIFCGTSIPGGGCYGCQYIVSCDMVYQNSATEYQATITPNFSACLALCDSSSNCDTVDYQKSTGNCTLFSTGDDTTFTANSDFDVGEYNGFCTYPNGLGNC